MGRAVATAFAVALCLGSGVAPVHADSGRLRIELPDGGLSLDRLAPGTGGSTRMRVFNGSPESADLVLQAVDVTDDENVCTGQEARDGDVSCGADGGELSSWLRIGVSQEGGPAWEGSLADLAAGAVIAEGLPPGAELPLDVAVELPFAAGNDTMTDHVEFGLRWTATARTGQSDTEILGVDAFAGGSGAAGSGVPLPFTGATVEPWLLWFAGSLVAGGCVLLVASRREVRPAY